MLLLQADGLLAQPSHLQVCPHARHQFARAERLDQVIIGPGLQPLDARLFPGARGEQNDGKRSQHSILAHPRQQAKAVEPGHHHI